MEADCAASSCQQVRSVRLFVSMQKKLTRCFGILFEWWDFFGMVSQKCIKYLILFFKFLDRYNQPPFEINYLMFYSSQCGQTLQPSRKSAFSMVAGSLVGFPKDRRHLARFAGDDWLQAALVPTTGAILPCPSQEESWESSSASFTSCTMGHGSWCGMLGGRSSWEDAVF